MTIIVDDDFSGGTITSGTDIEGRTPDTVNTPGNTWSDISPNTIEMDGAGNARWAANGNAARIDVETPDHMTVVLFNAGGAENRGIVICRSSVEFYNTAGQDGYDLLFRPDTDDMLFRSRVNNSAATLQTIGLTMDFSTDYYFAVSADGDQIKAYADTSYPPAQVGTTETNTAVDGVTVGGNYAQFVGGQRTDGAGRFRRFVVDDLVAGGTFQAAWARGSNTIIMGGIG